MSATLGSTLGQTPTSPTAGGPRRRPAIGSLAVAVTPAGLYEMLRVKETASPREIKAAYRSLAKQLHPDVASAADHGGGPDFVEVHQAYATLSDPAARARYDRSVGRISLGLAGDSRLRRRRWETDQCW